MDIRIGEKVSGVVSKVSKEGYRISLCNNITGFAPKDYLENGIEPSELTKGAEVKVRVEEKSDEGVLQLALTKLFTQDNFQKKPDKYLKNISNEKKNGEEKSTETKTSEEIEEWFSEVEDTFSEIKENRKERLSTDFWTI